MLFDLFFGQLLADLAEGFDRLPHHQRECLNKNRNHRAPTFSRTNGSSMAARFSRGERRTCPNSGPPTYSVKSPSSSLSAVRTSSSSSTESGTVHVRRLHAIDEILLRPLTIKEWNELIASSLGTEGQRDSREAVNGIKAEENIIVLERV